MGIPWWGWLLIVCAWPIWAPPVTLALVSVVAAVLCVLRVFKYAALMAVEAIRRPFGKE